MSSVLSDIINKFSNKKTVKSCEYIENSLFFDYQNNVKICPYEDIGIVTKNFDGLWLDIDKISGFRKQLLQDFSQNIIPNVCQNCINLKEITETKRQNTIKNLHLAIWKQCYINCQYCDFPKIEELEEANYYNIVPIIEQLTQNKIIDKETRIIFECGDPCIHPQFDKIMFYFINCEMKNIVVNTPALRYCESIAKAIGKNIVEVVIPFDSGCPYIYEKIKGTNKFDIATTTIKRYLECQEPNQKRVILKFTILNGINDNQKEILDWFIMARDMGIRKLALEVERKWYNQIKYSIPYYLKELIQFAKNISEYNSLEIEFEECANAIYKTMIKEEN